MRRRRLLLLTAGVAGADPSLAAARAPRGAHNPSPGGNTIMAFDNLPTQAPINPRAAAHGETCLLLSRLAAMTTRCTLDVSYGADPAQRLDLYVPADRR